jgi:uncharacterized membrane-anchored protein YhcB (DUF1043 family)
MKLKKEKLLIFAIAVLLIGVVIGMVASNLTMTGDAKKMCSVHN